jgi:hypothetical protein
LSSFEGNSFHSKETIFSLEKNRLFREKMLGAERKDGCASAQERKIWMMHTVKFMTQA